jgi:hypothetical protein
MFDMYSQARQAPWKDTKPYKHNAKNVFFQNLNLGKRDPS